MKAGLIILIRVVPPYTSYTGHTVPCVQVGAWARGQRRPGDQGHHQVSGAV